MGVRLLLTYIENCVKDGVKDIDIRQEVEDYKSIHSGNEPLIVIDLLAMRHIFSLNNFELMVGGRYNLYTTRVTDLFSKIKSLGVRLAFFSGDGPGDGKLATALERVNDKYKDGMDALKEIYSGADLTYHLNIKAKFPLPFFTILKELVKPFGKVHIPTLNDCDKEIADYANKNNAFAIISNDTDFLIFEGNWRFWSSRKLNVDNLKTIEFNRIALRQTLGLKCEQMALFATMSGNDFIPYNLLADFRRKIQRTQPRMYYRNQRKQNSSFHFQAVVDQIHSLNLNVRSISNEQVRVISRLIFKEMDDQSGADLVQLSLKSYDCTILNTNKEPEMLCLILEKDLKKIYELLMDRKPIIHLPHFDLSRNDLMPFFNLISPLIRRIMGIVLNHNDKPVTRTFYCKLEHEKDYEKVELEPEYPPKEVPPLDQLLFCDVGKDSSLDEMRLQLMCWMISCKLSPDTVRSIPVENGANCITILFLIENNQIDINEADCLLLACNCPNNVRDSLKLEDLKRINERDYRIAALFIAVQNHIKDCFFTVGWSKFCHYMTFDGLYFHHLRQKWSASLGALILREYNSLRIYAN